MKGNCVICDAEIIIHMCCSGRECGCMGMPTEPPVCSNDCYDKYMVILNENKNTRPKEGEIKP
jgi:hypothetical protein